MDLQGLLHFLLENGPPWIESQKNARRPDALPLSQDIQSKLEGFFDEALLKNVRVKSVPRIDNPDFYARYKEIDLSQMLDFRAMMAMTFDDTIVIAEGNPMGDQERRGLLFHELVHVVQYKVLGIDGFLRQYIQGWFQNGFSYFLIPLEAQAYELQGRYVSEPEKAFSVVEEVRLRNSPSR